MKSRITAKFLVVAALLVLVINVFSSFGSLFVQAQTTSTGYKVDVTYQDNSAKLTGNTSEVLQGYQLTSLTDDSTGQQYDPSTFSMEVTKNGTYTFTLGYTMSGISTQTHSEKVTVVVDKLATGDANQVADTGVMAVSTLETRESSNVSVNLYAYENYNSSTPVSSDNKLGTAKLPSGEFTSNVDAINEIIKKSSSSIGNRQYGRATLVRSDGTEIIILGAWDNEGKIYYEPAIDNSSSDSQNQGAPGIAYEANDGDEIRVYCQLISRTLFKLDTSAISDSSGKYKNLNVSALENGNQVAEGSKVIVTFDWDISIYDLEVSIKYNTNQTQKLEKTKQYNVDNRKYQGTFTMPSADVTLEVSPNNKSNVRWIGLYNAASDKFQNFEVGGTRLSMITDPTNKGEHRTKAYSLMYRNYGRQTDSSSIKYGWGKFPILDSIKSYENQSYFETFTPQVYQTNSSEFNNLLTNFFQQSNDTVEGYYRVPTNADDEKKTINYPVQDYEAGSTLQIRYEAMRGKADSYNGKSDWWEKGDPGLKYIYLPATTGTIDVFPNQRNQSIDDKTYQKSFQRYTFKMYQSELEYNNDPYKESYGVVSPKNGMYPVTTILPNGMKITVYPEKYEYNSGFNPDDYVDGYVPNPEKSYLDVGYNTGTAASRPNDTSLVLPRATFKIVLENCWDDIRVSVGLGTSTIQESQQIVKTSGIDKLFARGDTNTITDEYSDESYVNGSTNYAIKGSYAPKSNGIAYQYYKIKPKDGYSIPIPTRAARIYQAAGVEAKVQLIDGHKSGDVVTANKAESSIGNKFIAGRLAGTQSIGSSSKNIEAKNFYENDEGYFYYTILADNNKGTESQVTFTSEPIKFDVTFKKFLSNGGDYKPSDKKYDVETQQYFSVPNKIPFSSDTNTFFQGWDLKVFGKGLPSDGVSINLGSYNNEGYYAPGDAVDIVEIYNALKPQLGISSIGTTEYSMEFQPVYASTPVSTTSVSFSKTYQTDVDGGYGNNKTSNYSVLNNSPFQVTGVGEHEIQDEVEYQKNNTTSSPTFIKSVSDSESKEFKFYYDKTISVAYDKGTGSGVVPSDANKYTTVSGNSNTITLQDGSGLTNGSSKFSGWKLKASDSSGTVEGTKVYDPKTTSTIDLSSLDGDNSKLRKKIFDTGQVSLVAQYEDVKSIQNVNGAQGGDTAVSMSDTNYENSPQGKWIYDGGGETGQDTNDKTFTITGKFKYEGGDSTSYDSALANGKIYYALYKKDPANGVELSSNKYQLWKATKHPSESNSNKVEDVTFSKLDSQGYFTVTAKIKNAPSGNTITYGWDNNAQYRIFCWSASNPVNEATFSKDGTISDTGKKIDSTATFDNLPSYTTKTRVLEKLQITATGTSVSGQRINARKLIYNDQKLTISYEVTTGNSMLTKEEAEQEFNIAVGKQDPPKSGDAEGTNSSNIQLWYGKKPFSNFDSSGITTQGKETTRDKLKVPTIELKDANDGRSNKFIITVTELGDNATATPRWQSEAKYYLYAWNGANTTPPTITKTPNGGTNNYTINNDSETVSGVPSKVYTTYIINDTKTEVEPSGRAFYGTVSYPANITVQENSSTKKLESSVMKVNLNASWVDSSGATHGNTGGITPSAKIQPVEHDFSYGVTLTGGNVSTSSSGTSVKLTQGTSTKSVDAKILNASGGVISNGSLGTLEFYANNPSGVQELGFKLQTDSIPSSLTKDVFSGTIGYSFTRNDLTGGGST